VSGERPHPDQDELQSLLDGEHSDLCRRRVAGHVDRCGRCREQVSGLLELFGELDRIERAPGLEPDPNMCRRVMAVIRGG